MLKAKKNGTKGNFASLKVKGFSNKEGKYSQERLNQMIRNRAYFIWEEKGRPLGHEWETWFQAEREILEDYE